jgi:hypothetical protein
MEDACVMAEVLRSQPPWRVRLATTSADVERGSSGFSTKVLRRQKGCACGLPFENAALHEQRNQMMQSRFGALISGTMIGPSPHPPG